MGVINVTPDSFSDGGRHLVPAHALAAGERMLADGAHILDVGGESTRPGAEPVALAEELARVMPVIEALHEACPEALVSIDTSKPEVMRAAVAAGAGMINDVTALAAPGALETAAALGVPVCLMHMQGEPRTMQREPRYADVVAEVREFLLARARACLAAGIARERIVIDPGFGFGKTVAHNLTLLARLSELADTGYEVLVGLSRKSMIGTLLGRPVDQRATASAALALLAVQQGASIVRVHDVAETADVLGLAQRVEDARGGGI
ncbi:MAG: dihydropteroate synthase [Gammaproteobacteria bacterium]|nr:dihydropteroate synthase [Gammaproteobacteria bacterium]